MPTKKRSLFSRGKQCIPESNASPQIINFSLTVLLITVGELYRLIIRACSVFYTSFFVTDYLDGCVKIIKTGGCRMFVAEISHFYMRNRDTFQYFITIFNKITFSPIIFFVSLLIASPSSKTLIKIYCQPLFLRKKEMTRPCLLNKKPVTRGEGV